MIDDAVRKMCWGLLLLFTASSVNAQLTIEVTDGVDNPHRIAIVPFQWQGGGPLPEDIAAVVAADLERSGRFIGLDRSNMLSLPSRREQVFFRDWRVLNQDYLLIGNVSQASPGGSYSIQYELYDIYKQERMIGEMVPATDDGLRDVAHFISDKVYQMLTGVRGAFSTRIAYVTAERDVNGADRFQLQVADADGYRARSVLESDEPILSIDWSPDKKRLAYVSFESGRPAIYLQDLSTGTRQRLPSHEGLNGSPAWSPDGRKLALTLSRDGNAEIYTYELSTGNLVRVTRHFGIDTEASWAPDGRSLVFTSSRGGKPQIYRVTLATGKVERLTFRGEQNMAGQLSQDGRYLVMVHRRNGLDHIAVQDLQKDEIMVLTQTELDESPSIAPNGSMVIYATNYQGKGILAAVSVDGSVRFRLPSKYGDVREPAWSPY